MAAVSGGGDSMALAQFLAAYQQKTQAEILCVSVDHGLRAGALKEAESAGAACRALGLSHRLMRWTGEKPLSGLQAAARAARYGLLCDAAHDWRAGAILTGHTADDQAETVFMRLSRGAGARGLSGMRARIQVASGAGAPVLLLRPLLGERRAALRGKLRAVGCAHQNDPSNDDQCFERVRVRQTLAALEEQGVLSCAALCAVADRAREAADHEDRQIAELFKQAGGIFYRWGGARLDGAALDHPLAAAMLRRLFFAVGGQVFPPSRESASRALTQIAAGKPATLAGALARPSSGAARRPCAILFEREAAALTGRAGVAPMTPASLAPGDGALWDRRFIVENTGALPVLIAPLAVSGPAALSQSAARPGVTRDGAPPRDAFLADDINIKSLINERFSGNVIRYE